MKAALSDTTRMGAAGRIVIPEVIRKKLNLDPGTLFLVSIKSPTKIEVKILKG